MRFDRISGDSLLSRLTHAEVKPQHSHVCTLAYVVFPLSGVVFDVFMIPSQLPLSNLIPRVIVFSPDLAALGELFYRHHISLCLSIVLLTLRGKTGH